MKALVYRGPGEIDYDDMPDPILPDRSGAIVQIAMCGLCGSDLHPYHVHPGHAGYCIGHEAIGKVVEAGRDVRGFKVGDRVLVSGSVGCGRCAPCRVGEVALCEADSRAQVFGQGTHGLGGCQAQAVAVPAADRNLWHLPDHISDEVGILLTDNLATAWFCARRARVGPGDTVAVIGLGPVGLQCVLSAQAMGAARVLGLDLLDYRRSDAARLGAEPVEGSDPVHAVRELTGRAGVDVVLDANGSAATINLAIDLVRRGGRVSVIGVSEAASIPFPVLKSLLKNVEFHTALCSVQAELPRLFAALETGKLHPHTLAGIVTHHVGLSEGSRAYALFDARQDGVLKIVFDPTQ